MNEQPDTLEQQIQQLERELAQKRTELGMDVTAPYERSEVHATVGEQIRDAVPSYQPSTKGRGGDVPSYQDPALAQSVQELVTVAFTQSIQAAILQAAASHNPALLDALHDVLVDQLHQELVARQKIQPAP